MCNQSKQPGEIISAINRQAMDSIDPGQRNIAGRTAGDHVHHGGTNNVQRQRPSPIRMRRRGESSSSSTNSATRSVKSNNGRHVTNINRINVINNFGMDSRDRAKEHVGWIILRLVLAALILIWAGLIVSVVKGSDTPKPSSSSAHESKLSRLQKLTEAVANSGGIRGNAQSSPSVDRAKAQEGSSANITSPAASISEPSLFGNKSPSDFQLYTPNAPSCSKPLDAQSVSYTLVSQLSDDRLWMVQYHCARWGQNPMSIIVFTDRSATDVKNQLVSKEFSNGRCSEENLTVQTVSKKYDPTGKEYPVNLLRNMAFSAVKTSHIVYADVDFWPASDLYTILSDMSIKERLASDSKLATVLPVFQMNRRCHEYKDCRGENIPSMPKDKAGLIRLIKKKQASTFDPTNVGGHGSTKYITWRDQETGTFVDLPCIKSNRYEPYLAFRYCSDLPPFQEGFTGYGKNKMTWVMQLRRSGYLFSQLGGAFLVHYPHLDSKSRLEWNKKPKAMEKYHKSASELLEKEDGDIDWGSFKRARVDALFLDFKEWLDGTVEDESRVPMCDDALNDDVRLWVHSDRSTDDDDEGIEEEDGEDADASDEANDAEGDEGKLAEGYAVESTE